MMTITVPDETARRIEAIAAARGETIEHVAVEALDASPVLAGVPDVSPSRRRRLGFVGAGTSGDRRPTDIHRLRQEIAGQATA